MATKREPTVFDRIKYARKQANINQKEFASMINMTPSNWNKIEAGKLNISFDLASTVSRVLCVDIRYLSGEMSYESAVTDNLFHEYVSDATRMAELDDLIDQVRQMGPLQDLIRRVGHWPSPAIRLFTATADTFEAGVEAAGLNRP